MSGEDLTLDDRFKGIPGGTAPFPLAAIGQKGWNLLRGDLPLPVAALKSSALEHNGAWMRRFLERSGARLAPHGKTTMSPQLFERQLRDGAWAITLATVAQVQVARRFGISRVLLANQVTDPAGIRYLVAELARDPGFELYALVDSLEGARLLAEAARSRPLERPLPLLLERGFPGGRCGCRTLQDALAVARAVKQAGPALALRGVEAFEGLRSGTDERETEAAVLALLDDVAETARACEGERLFAPGPLILTAGGSAYYDLAAERLASAVLGRETWVLLRAGCYLSHDAGTYRRAFARLLERSPLARELGEGLRPALELWAAVLSRPEPTRAVLGLGKRDASFDAGLPQPDAFFRAGEHVAPAALSAGHATAALNDQHALVDVPVASPLRVGDLVRCQISHPCLTFDRWAFLPVIDDAYNVIDGVRTFF